MTLESGYHTLMQMGDDPANSDAVGAEFARILMANGPLGLVWTHVTLNAPVIHPGKTKETELDVADLLLVIDKTDVPLARDRAATLLNSKAIVHSYSTAAALIGDLKKETNLRVIRELKTAFEHVVPEYQDQGQLDGSDLLSWWKDNSGNVQKEDSDSKPVPPK